MSPINITRLMFAIQDTIAVLQFDLRTLESRLDQSLNSHEHEKKSLSEQLRELANQKEQAQQEVRPTSSLFTVTGT